MLDRHAPADVDQCAVAERAGIQRDEGICIDRRVLRKVLPGRAGVGRERLGQVHHANAQRQLPEPGKLRLKEPVDEDQLRGGFFSEAELRDRFRDQLAVRFATGGPEPRPSDRGELCEPPFLRLRRGITDGFKLRGAAAAQLVNPRAVRNRLCHLIVCHLRHIGVHFCLCVTRAAVLPSRSSRNPSLPVPEPSPCRRISRYARPSSRGQSQVGCS